MNRNALVVIDVQNYFVGKGDDLPQRIAAFIENHTFDFVLFTKFVNHADSNFFKVLKWKKCFGSPDTDIHPLLSTYAKKYPVFEKSTYSIFKSKKFVQFLKKHNITTVFLCGMDSDGCVLASAYDGFDRGYHIEVIKELCRSHHGDKLNTAALQIIKMNVQIISMRMSEAKEMERMMT